MSDIDTNPVPQGELALQTIAMPRDTNADGDIFGGWLLSQMDLAGLITAMEVAKGRAATVAIDGMAFLTKRPDEVLSAVHLPELGEGWRSTYWKLRRRGSFDFPVVSVGAATMEGTGSAVSRFTTT